MISQKAILFKVWVTKCVVREFLVYKCVYVVPNGQAQECYFTFCPSSISYFYSMMLCGNAYVQHNLFNVSLNILTSIYALSKHYYKKHCFRTCDINLQVCILKRKRKKSVGQNPGTPKQKLEGPLPINRHHTHSSLASIAIEAIPRTLNQP